ncbi:MAG: hydrogenase expression/formation protein HypE [Byssovorax sp.]
MPDDPELSCPLPFAGYDRIVLAHGGGGRVMHRLIHDVFLAAFGDPARARGHDGAVLDLRGPVAITTDAFTVRPLFFPGGDIGSLAVHGTVNDLAMCGARPLYLTASFILEEGLPLEDLRRIVDSMAGAARAAGVSVVTGDTKVVERGKGDGVFIAVTGIGRVESRQAIAADRLRPGDAVLVSGPIGDHGVAVMLARDDLGIEAAIASDSASVAAPVLTLLEAGVDVRCLRDPTRGGLGTVLCEIAAAASLGLRIAEEAIPVRPVVADACELLGLDPLYVACEGRFVAVVAERDRELALDVLRGTPGGEGACVIGHVTADHPGTVVLEKPLGGERVLDMLTGEQLPRIC